MNASTLLSKVLRTSSKQNRRRKRQHSRLPSLERLEARQLLTAAMAWDGDALQITGSDSDDFIAVQQDELGLKVFTEDAVFTEYEGRAFDTATSINVSGQGGNDVLFSYQTDLPVSLNGNGGNDFLYSDTATDVLDGGEGFNWIQTDDSQGTGEDAFGIPGLDVIPSNVTVTPKFDEDGRIGLQVDVAGEVDVAGVSVDVTGGANVSTDGVAVTVTGTVANWDDAFGIAGLDMNNTSLTVSAGSDIHNGDGYRVDLSSELQVSGTEISIDGSVTVLNELTTATFTGTVANWDDAFGITGLDLSDGELNVVGHSDGQDDYGLHIDVAADMLVEDTLIDVSGGVDIAPGQIDAVFSGSVTNWDDAFGINGLDLTDSQVSVTAYSDREDDYSLKIDLLAEMQVDDVDIDVSGSVDITPEEIDAVFNGSVDNWDDAFGIDGLDLTDSEVGITAWSDRHDNYDLQFDLLGDMDINGINVRVAGSVDVEPDRIDGTLTGRVAADWDDAFGISGLHLDNTKLTVNAVRDQNAGSSLEIDFEADMDLSGTAIAVTGEIDVDDDGVSGSLTGVIAGTWTSAFGIAPLHLHDTIVTIAGSRTAAGSEMSVGVTAGMDLLGTGLDVSGTVDVTSEGVNTSLTASVTGEWMDALGIPGLELKDTALTFRAGSGSTGLDIDLDTDLKLFGGYIEMVGDLGISPSGIDLSFSPPESLGFTDLLGIPGFTLDDADLTVTTGTSGLSVVVGSTIDLGNVDVDFEGAFTVSRNEVRASLTGRVAEWDNAFEVPGLNLNDVVLTLGAESSVGGASMYIGVGAGIEIGRSELGVAGLVGFGATGWEVAFRGSIDALSSDDLIDFANTMNQANDPTAAEIPDGALGDLELRTAYINFAPYGGNEALGIADGFGIGGAFYDDGKLLGSGEFIVDMANGVFEVGLDIPKMDLGPVELNDVLVDIRIAPTDSHYHVAGTASLLGAEVSLEGKISANSFSLKGDASVDMAGLSTSVEFVVDQSGIRFVATAGGGAINAIKGNVTKDLRAAANIAQAAIDHAQAGVDLARKGVKNLEADLAEARADAQKEVNKVKANINKAKVVVDRARASKDYWARQKSARYKKWRSAVAATRRAVWYKKAYYKGVEAGRYASYKYAAGRYSVQAGIYNTANAGYKAVRNAAGWVLDNAGVEANPEVVGIKVLLAAADLGLDAAELVLDGVEHANSGVFQALNFADSLKVNRITIAGNVSTNVDVGVRVTVDYSLGGRNHSFSLNASTENLVQQVGRELLAVAF